MRWGHQIISLHVILLLILSASELNAQESPLTEGDYVRLFVGPWEERVEGKVLQIREDSLTVGTSGGSMAYPLEVLSSIERSTGTRTNTREGAIAGLVAGAAVGFVLGATLIEPCDATASFCILPPTSEVQAGVMGGLVGGFIGSAIGASIGAHVVVHRWERVSFGAEITGAYGFGGALTLRW